MQIGDKIGLGVRVVDCEQLPAVGGRAPLVGDPPVHEEDVDVEQFGKLADPLGVGVSLITRSVGDYKLGSVAGNISEVKCGIESLRGSAGGLTEEVDLLKLDRNRALSDLEALEQRADDLAQARQRDRMQVLLAVLTMGVALAMVELYLVVRFRRVRQING